MHLQAPTRLCCPLLISLIYRFWTIFKLYFINDNRNKIRIIIIVTNDNLMSQSDSGPAPIDVLRSKLGDLANNGLRTLVVCECFRLFNEGICFEVLAHGEQHENWWTHPIKGRSFSFADEFYKVILYLVSWFSHYF